MTYRPALWLLSALLCLSACGPDPGATTFEALGSERDASDRPLRLRHLPTGILLKLVPAGRVTLGTPAQERERDGDEAQHEAALGAFYLAETEVSVGQWRAVMGDELLKALPDDDSLPAGGVSWHLAQKFLEALNRDAPGWRLPNEAEWEYACRAGTTTIFAFGENITPAQVNYNGNYPYTDAAQGLDRAGPVPTGSLPANPWGFHEMHGNVWEWCSDLYVEHPERGEQAMDRDGSPRVMRGGAFTDHAKRCRSGYRDGYPPNSSGAKYGFRVARSVAP
jgi:formylglycine-generating enzyme required for sulfatase activity